MTPEEQSAPTLPAPGLCIVEGCASLALGFGPLADYCAAHAQEWIMSEDRAEFAESYAIDYRREAAE